MFSRQYHINCLSIQSTYNFIYAYTVFSIFVRLYHINCETDMHIFSCLGRLYHINSQMLQVYETLVRGSPLKNDGFETICFVKLIIDNFWCRNICIVSTQIGYALLSAADFLGFTKLFVSSPSHPLISAIICNRGIVS